MSDFFGEHEVTVSGERVGTVKVFREGLMTVIAGEVSLLSDDVLRLGARTDGETVSVGVLMPQGEKLCVKKKYSPSALRQAQLGGECRFVILGMEEKAPEEENAVPVSETVDEQADFFPPEELLPEEYRGIEGAKVYAEGDIVFLAVPICGGEFPLMHIIMSGRAERIDGEEHIVFAFRNGELLEGFQQSPGNPS